MITKIVKYVKKNSGKVIGITVLILVIIAILLIKNLFMFDDFQAIYGTRLEGISKVAITNKEKTAVKNSIGDAAKKVNVRTAGRIIDILIVVSKETSLEDAKKLGEKTLESFSDEQKKFYDIQIMIETDEESNQYPIIGYKHQSRDAITWTKDRAEN